MGYLYGTHAWHWVLSSWAQQALQEINSFQAGSKQQGGMFFLPMTPALSPPPEPSQAITHSLTAISAVPGCACLPASVGRAVAQYSTQLLDLPFFSCLLRLLLVSSLLWQTPGAGFTSSAYTCPEPQLPSGAGISRTRTPVHKLASGAHEITMLKLQGNRLVWRV